jgi:SAM-dependent methyltransferase
MTRRFIVDFGSDGAPAEDDGRLHGPAFGRNHRPIWEVIGPWLSQQTGDVLELGSGTGQHTLSFAQQTPQLVWWPSDINDAHLRSIRAWRNHAGADNVRDPQRIDLTNPHWTMTGTDAPSPGTLTAMLAINLLHIAPWTVSQHLIGGAGRWLKSGGRLLVYGPFKRDGAHTAPSNESFDASLRAGNPAWGLRDTAKLAALAQRDGLALVDTVPMPSNNFILIFERR